MKSPVFIRDVKGHGKKVSRILGSGCAVFIMAAQVSPGAGMAQSAFSADGGDAAFDSRLENIVVTARKREETVQDIPLSIAVYSQEQVQRWDISNLERLAAHNPQFVVGRASNGSGAQLTLRGIGSSSTSIGIEQSVAVVVDGVYYGQGRTINDGFFDLQRVEVLKGPQALFYGKNATAGVISFTTADPTSEFEAMARAGYEFESQNVIGEAVISSPLTEDLGLRVAVRGSKMFDGYFTNRAAPADYTFVDVGTGNVTNGIGGNAEPDVPQIREFLGRATLKWTPQTNLTATLKFNGTVSENNSPAYNYVLYRCPVGGQSQLDPGVRCSDSQFDIYQNDKPDQLRDANVPFRRKDGDTYNKYRSYGVTGMVEYEFDSLTLTSVTNYNYTRNTFDAKGEYQSGPKAVIWTTENSSFKSFSTELRALTSYDGPLNVMTGVYYQKTKRKFGQWPTVGDPNVGILWNSAAPQDYNQYTAFEKQSETSGETISGFGQVIYEVTPKLEATAGVRYTHETKDSYFEHPYVLPGYDAVYVPNVRVNADQTFNDWSPEATLSYDVTDDVTAYGAYRSAYKSGGFSNSAILSGFSLNPMDDFTFDKEKAKGFELGVKSVLADNQVILNLTAYRYVFSNLQVDYFNSVVFAYETYNAGSAVTKGVEVEFDYAPRAVAGLSFRGTANYNRARYKDFIAPCNTGQTPAQGCDMIGLGGVPVQDLTGLPTAVAPLWTASLGVNYERPINSALWMGISMNGTYSDNYLASGFGDPYSYVDDYVTIDAAARLYSADDRWEFAIIGKNLTNELFITGVMPAPNTGGGTGTAGGFGADQLGFAALPRTVQAQVTVRF